MNLAGGFDRELRAALVWACSQGSRYQSDLSGRGEGLSARKTAGRSSGILNKYVDNQGSSVNNSYFPGISWGCL